MTNGCISKTKQQPGDSKFSSGLLKVKDLFYKYTKNKLGDGKRPDFGKMCGLKRKL